MAAEAPVAGSGAPKHRASSHVIISVHGCLECQQLARWLGKEVWVSPSMPCVHIYSLQLAEATQWRDGRSLEILGSEEHLRT